MDQSEKARALKALHDSGEIFVIPNPWDAGSAKVLASLGFKALTTTSAGVAFGFGKPDTGLTRKEAISNAAAIVAAVDLPVAADLQNGYGDTPEDAAQTIREAAAVGLVGGSIEDSTGDPNKPIYDFSLTLERFEAAAEAARALPFPFALVGRSENFLHGVNDLDDTIRRLQAYEAAGAEVLFAPGLPSLEALRTVCASLTKPLSVVMSANFTVAQLAEAGVRWISVGGRLAQIALTAARRAAEELLIRGTYEASRDILSVADFDRLMRETR
jgi:2-methylisocitrate lyase-like PEP mutase family enzyme